MNKLKTITIWVLAPMLVGSTLAYPHNAEAYCKKKKKSVVATEQVKSAETSAQASDSAPVKTQELLPLDPQVIHGTLPNGLQYFIRKNSKPENRMELRLAVNAGSIQEDDDQKGLAHFLEHMAFNGSKNFEKNDLINYVESIGTQFGPHLNAYTSFDETVYMLQVPTDQPEILDKSLLILEDWAHGLTLDKEEIEKERGVVVSEWRSSLGPQQRMQNEFLPVLFNGSRYPDRLPIGDTAIIKGATKNVVERFYKDWYRPDLMAVILVGDFDPMEMEKEVIKRFSDIPSVPNARKKEIYPIPPHQETLVSIVTDKEAPYAQVIMFEKHPAKDNNNIIGYREYVKHQLINNILNERYKEILQQPAPPFFVALSNYGGQLRNLDAFTNLAVGTSDNVEKMLKVLFEETYRASKFGFTAGEFGRAVASITNNYDVMLNEKDKTESSKYASEYVSYYLTGETAPGIEIENQLVKMLIPTITLEDLNQTLRALITHKNNVIVITAPEKDKDILPSKERILALHKEVAQSDLQAKEEQEVATDLIANDPKSGTIVKIEKDDKNNIEEWTLSNGTRVLVKPTDFKNDEVLINAFSAGGSSLYGNEDFFTISNTAPLINESGFGDFDAVSLSRALAGKNLRSTPYISELEEGVRASASPKDLETLFQLIHLNFTAPRKDSIIYQSYITKNKSLYANLLANPMIYFQKAMLETLYGNHLRRSFPAMEDFDKINLEKAANFYKERFANASDFQFVIVGNVNTEELKPLVEKYIASLPSQIGSTEKWVDTKANFTKGKINKEITMGAAPKTNVMFTYSGNQDWSRDNEMTLQILSEVLDIKLRESLREDKGGVYGVSVQSAYERIPQAEFYTIISYNADPEYAADLETEAMKVIESLKSNPVDEKTLSKVKEKIKRATETELKENDYWAQTIKYAATFNEPLPNTEEYLHKVQNITPEQVRKAAQTFLKGDNFIRLVMSPQTK